MQARARLPALPHAPTRSSPGQRLVEIIANLNERIEEATNRGWLGEVEGLQASLTAARQKLQQMRKIREALPAAVLLDPPRPWTPKPPTT